MGAVQASSTTTKTVPITVNGDTIDEPQFHLGGWILVRFSNPSANAALDTGFEGTGIIADDDPT